MQSRDINSQAEGMDQLQTWAKAVGDCHKKKNQLLLSCHVHKAPERRAAATPQELGGAETPQFFPACFWGKENPGKSSHFFRLSWPDRKACQFQPPAEGSAQPKVNFLRAGEGGY